MQSTPSMFAGGLPAIDAGDLLRNRLVALVLPPRTLPVAEIRGLGARDVLVISRTGPLEGARQGDGRNSHAVLRYSSRKSAYMSNCSIAILHGMASSAAMDSKALARLDTILLRRDWSLALSMPAILRHSRRGRLALRGEVRLANRVYLVFDCPLSPVDNRRQYGPAGVHPAEFLKQLQGLSHVVLRWPEAIEDRTHEGDIDILASAADAPRIADRFSSAVATYPLDVYSEDGSGGFFFNSAPYFTRRMSQSMLESATRRPSGLSVPSDRWRFLSFAYHLLLHIKSRRVPIGTNVLTPSTFRHPKYLAELQRLAAVANEPAPKSFDDIEAALRAADAWPNIDLLGFYAEKNPFLKDRYFNNTRYAPGLMTLFVRDFGAGTEPVEATRALLKSRFIVLAEGPVDDRVREDVDRGIRGGNWSDPTAPSGEAKAVYWFVCHDPAPAKPNARTQRKRPRFDNENINFKHDIRASIGAKGVKEQRIIHTSDNTAEAIEHIEVLGLGDDPGIAAVRHRLTNGTKIAP